MKHCDARKQMLNEGASIIDIGGASSRPGAEEIPVDVERARVLPVIAALHIRFPDALLSIDTLSRFRSPRKRWMLALAW